MTREHRLLLSLDEIRGLRWQCGLCQTAVSYPLRESIVKLPDRCPVCQQAPPNDPTALQAEQILREFAVALKRVLNAPKWTGSGSPTISLEFVEPPA